MKQFAFCVLLLNNLLAYTQSASTPTGARAAGMGYASASLADEAALFNNVGAMSVYNKTAAFFSYEVQPKLIGSNRTSAGFTVASKIGCLGLGTFRFGDDLYSEQMVTVGYSNKIGITSLGVRANYIQYRAEGFGIRDAIRIDFGGLTQITSHIAIGAYITNINQARISDSERLPTKLTVGLGLRPADHLVISTEVEKDLDYNATWRTGAEYAINKKIFVRTGFNLNPNATFFGLGFISKRLKIDYALKFSNALGATHQSSAAYLFEKRNQK